MSLPQHEPWLPTAAELAAYCAGQLSAEQAARLEAWLEAHPEAAERWGQDPAITSLCRQTQPDQPTPRVWQQVWHRLCSALPSRPAQARPALRARRLALAGLAAGFVLCVGLGWYLKTKLSVPTSPLPVLSEDEVHIVSLEHDDSSALVVGKPPVMQALALLETGEVDVNLLEPEDGQSEPLFVTDTQNPMVVVVARE